jgi:predicted dehydrogenase
VLTHADIITPAKPNLGTIYLNDAIEWGSSHDIAESNKLRKGTTFDYATIAWEFQNGAVGAAILSHAPILRKGLAPELELHGTLASLALDRIASTIAIIHPGQDIPEIEQVENIDPTNRFANYVFPALRQHMLGEIPEHPCMEDGWRVQIFTDAATLSAKRGTWVELAEVDAESS